MNIEAKFCNGILKLFIAGDIDEYSCGELRTYLDIAIENGGFHTMIINLSHVDFMDSTGIGMLLGRYKKIKALQLNLYVEHLTPQIDKVFRVSGLYQIIKAV